VNDKSPISLKLFNTFGFDVSCAHCISIETASQIQDLYQHGFFQTPFRILSGGSNVLLTRDLHETVLLNRIQGIEQIKETAEHVYLRFGAGEFWHDAVLFAVRQNLGGIENLSLIPGCVGAAPIQNIGAYGVELKDVFDHLNAINLTTGKMETLYAEDCKFAYRDSVFKNDAQNKYFITDVCLRLDKNPVVKIHYGDIQHVLNEANITEPSIQDVSDTVIRIRKSKLPDPKDIGNSGSFFKNPVVPVALSSKLSEKYPDMKVFPQNEKEHKLAAGWLIEKAGWKGFRRQSVGVHAKQALVLVHYGGGKGTEIADLASEIQSDILVKFGVFLEFEVNIW